MRRLSIILISILSCMEAGNSLTLAEAVSNAAMNSPELSKILNSTELQKTAVTLSELGQFPTLSGKLYNGEYGKLQERRYDSVYSYELNLQAPMWQGNMTENEVAFQKAMLLKLDADNMMKIKELEYQVSILYYDTLLNKQILDMMYATLEQAKLEDKQAKEKFSKGVVDKLETVSAESFFAYAEYQVMNALNEYDASLYKLEAMMGTEAGQPSGVLEDMNTEFLSFSNDLRLKSLDLEEEIYLKRREWVKARYGWNVQFVAGLKSSFSDGGDTPLNYQVSAGIRIDLPLFDWLKLDMETSFFSDFTNQGGYYVSLSPQAFQKNNRFSDALTELAEIKYQLELIRLKKSEYRNEDRLQPKRVLEYNSKVHAQEARCNMSDLNYRNKALFKETGQATAKDVVDAKQSMIEDKINLLKTKYEVKKFEMYLDSIYQVVITNHE